MSESDKSERRKGKRNMRHHEQSVGEAQEKLAELEARLQEAESRLQETEERLKEETRRADEHRDLLQRVQADFINYKRRTEQERAEQVKFANSMLILKILPILDDFERAAETVQADLAGLNWVQGVTLIGRKLRAALEEEGLSRIDALGAEFDPRYHEAVVYEEAPGDEKDRVVAVLQNGYKLHDKVIRPAIVKVAGRRGVKAEDAPRQ
ncbi:MAG: nucleotide exchange factor GrpE [Chloroflexota bacterium]